MVGRISAASLLVTSILLSQFLVTPTGASTSRQSEDAARFQRVSLSSVRAPTLSTVNAAFAATVQCTATWTNIAAPSGSPVPVDTWWNLATGAPQPGIYTLSAGCPYDRATPANTPLVWPPAMEARLNGTETAVTDFRASTGEFKLITRVDVDGTTLEVDFSFEVTSTPTPTPTVAPTQTHTPQPNAHRQSDHGADADGHRSHISDANPDGNACRDQHSHADTDVPSRPAGRGL